MKGRQTRVTLEAVRRIALSLSGAEEGTFCGFPDFRVRGKPFAVLREDLQSLVARVSFEQRDEMIAVDPTTYYTADHHRGYARVPARLDRIHPDALQGLLATAWRASVSESRGKAPSG